MSFNNTNFQQNLDFVNKLRYKQYYIAKELRQKSGKVFEIIPPPVLITKDMLRDPLQQSRELIDFYLQYDFYQFKL